MRSDLKDSFSEAHTIRFQEQLERLKDEHGILKRELDLIQEQTSHMAAMLGSEQSKQWLQDIKRQMEQLMEKLDRHEQWEETEIFPILAGYACQGAEPTFWTSAWVLEEEHKQTERFVRSFLAYADGCEAAGILKLNKALSLLCVACSVLTDQLAAEEETVFPVVDEILGGGAVIDR